MAIFRKKQKAPLGAESALTLRTADGAPLYTFPGSVINSMRHLETSLMYKGALPARIAMVAALRQEGVTYTTLALATTLAYDLDVRVCVVDLNWSSPSDWPDDDGMQAGMADILRGTTDLDHALSATGIAGLSVLRAGEASIVERPTLAHSAELEKTLLELSELYDHLIIDLPAVHAASETLTLAESAGALAFVVNQGVTPEDEVRSALEELSGPPVLGVILNRSSSRVPRIIRRRIPGF